MKRVMAIEPFADVSCWAQRSIRGDHTHHLVAPDASLPLRM